MAAKALAGIQPLDLQGKPERAGKIVLMSIGMSNTTMEYTRFKQVAEEDSAKSSKVVLLDGAQGAQTGLRWADPKAPLWQKVDERMEAVGLSAKQVQAEAAAPRRGYL